MSERYKVPESKKIRVIIDTDAACEADDQYAIVHALMTQKFIIKGITALLILYAEKRLPTAIFRCLFFDEMQEYANSKKGGWTMGESLALGDSPVVGLGMDPFIGSFEERNSPVCSEGGMYISFNKNKIRVYKDIDSRFILEDMFSKLKIFYCDKS